MKLNRTSAFLVLFAYVLLVSLNATAQNSPSAKQLVQFYQEQINSKYYGDRMDAIVGLGHLGDEASGMADRLIKQSRTEQNNFYRLLCLWSLAEIGTYDGFEWSQKQARFEKPELTNGSFREVAARTALLASTNRGGNNMSDINRSLSDLYNKARGGDLTEKLTSIWALFQLGTSVTISTAERAASSAAGELSAEHGNYTRHLRYIRLVGPQAHKFFADKLAALVGNHEFSTGLTPKRALTAYTLAVIAYPDETPAVEQFKKDINERLNSPLSRGSALDDASALGPFACSRDIVSSLRDISENSSDDSDREEAENVLSFCR
jgi:hypothetical protein